MTYLLSGRFVAFLGILLSLDAQSVSTASRLNHLVRNWTTQDMTQLIGPLGNLSPIKKGAAEYEKARSKSDQHKVFTEYGVRSSLLAKLPYFNSVRFHVVDPMHNLLLGTAKHMMVIWTKLGIIT